MTFKVIKDVFDFPQVEQEITRFWEENRIFQKSIDIRAAHPDFVFYEGPPTANGLPHIGHALSRTIKDSVCRYKTMAGFRVERKAGWDTHGLPVELEVEKALGFSIKEKIEEYGIEQFNRKCRESVFKYKSEWDEFTRKLGMWLDLDNPYITYTNEYMETVWWILSQFHRKGFLYCGYKILPWCPRCGTALSSHEVAQGYEEVSDPSVFIRMELIDEPGTYFLVWTTTPWTLISNVALAVHADLDYVKVTADGERYILAAALADKLFPQGYEVEVTYKGKELEGREYKPLYRFMPIPSDAERSFCVCNADFVNIEEGTGIVHIAPAFGADDYELALKYKLPVIQAVDERGGLVDEVRPWQGLFVKEADPLIIEDLKSRGLLVRSEIYQHTYPFCWRCESPLLYYARKSWFIKTTGFKDRLLANNQKINWYPPEIKNGRFGEWLENNVDWALSRERYWGTPLNIWICEGCGAEKSIESIEELRRLGSNLPEPLDLHRPYMDNVTLKCEECSGTMHRVPETIDAWFDSGSMPYGQYHYPFEFKEEFPKRFPADFIAEGIDQTRGWFYSLLVISTFLFDEPAYKNIVVNELILTKDGQKMSKSTGNVVDPREVLSTYGADATRWYLMSTSQVWLPTRFDIDGVVETARKFLGTLKNTYAFFALYANIDGVNPYETAVSESDLTVLDRWLLSRVNTLADRVAKDYDGYQLTRATRMIQDFVINDLSNWYVRLSRRRFWGSENDTDKLAAYKTLHTALMVVVKLAAPVAPFLTEEIYRQIGPGVDPGQPESVHLCDFPKCDQSLVMTEVETYMELAQRVATQAQALRKDARLKVRQPLRKIVVVQSEMDDEKMLAGLEPLLKEELNVKEVHWRRTDEGLVQLRAAPVFKALGPKFGKEVNAAAEAIRGLAPDAVARLEKAGKIGINVGGHEAFISLADVTIEKVPAEGYAVSERAGITVALDISIDRELEAEGHARELINKIQNMRKKAGFNVTDLVRVGIQTTPEVNSAVDRYAQYIKKETLAEEIAPTVDETGFLQRWDINGHDTIISVKTVV